MAPDGQETADEQTKPPRLGAGTPADYGQTVGIVHLVEMTMQMQRTLGELSADIRHVNDTLDKKARQVGSPSGGVNGMALSIVGFLLLAIGVTAGIVTTLLSD